MIIQNRPYIDTHAHLCDAVFDPDRQAVLQRAAATGLVAVVAVGEDLADAQRNLAFSKTDSRWYPAAGLYPGIVDPEQAAVLVDFIRRERSGLWAVGEVGLDFWVVKDDGARECQRRIFSDFIAIAAEVDLPLNVHSRSAGRHAIAMLLNQGAQRVQLHAFDGRAATALPAVEAGYFFSIPPSIVRSRQKQKLVRQLPLSCLMAETDSPVLGPAPGVRNEPANVPMVIEAVAAIKGVSPAAVANAFYTNALRLYNMPLSPSGGGAA